jgi:hypothetical protein
VISPLKLSLGTQQVAQPTQLDTYLFFGATNSLGHAVPSAQPLRDTRDSGPVRPLGGLRGCPAPPAHPWVLGRPGPRLVRPAGSPGLEPGRRPAATPG